MSEDPDDAVTHVQEAELKDRLPLRSVMLQRAYPQIQMQE
jgi:hypothetical protein